MNNSLKITMTSTILAISLLSACFPKPLQAMNRKTDALQRLFGEQDSTSNFERVDPEFPVCLNLLGRIEYLQSHADSHAQEKMDLHASTLSEILTGVKERYQVFTSPESFALYAIILGEEIPAPLTLKDPKLATITIYNAITKRLHHICETDCDIETKTIKRPESISLETFSLSTAKADQQVDLFLTDQPQTLDHLIKLKKTRVSQLSHLIDDMVDGTKQAIRIDSCLLPRAQIFNERLLEFKKNLLLDNMNIAEKHLEKIMEIIPRGLMQVMTSFTLLFRKIYISTNMINQELSIDETIENED